MIQLTKDIEEINKFDKYINKNIMHLSVARQINGREVVIHGKRTISFGSCSYLGLENEALLKNTAIAAIEEYGTQFSSSRSYLALSLYDQLESKLEQIFGYPTLVTATTSLGHIACIPLLIQPKDAVIMDHQVHMSVGNAVKMVRSAGTAIETIRHNNLEMLERCIQKLIKKHDKVWYMADGIYSMFGDKAPIKELWELLEKYEQFHLYIDDAHGLGWTGKNGCGFVLSQVNLHEKMVIATSLAKSFASGGGAIICPTQELKNTILKFGSTLIFSGPIQPAVLAASIGSANFHLSRSLPQRQFNLVNKIRFFIQEAERLDLPLIKTDISPIFCIGLGSPKLGYELCQQMLNLGFYLNLAIYPAVPYKNTSLRITITCNTTQEDIKQMLATLSLQLDLLLRKHNSSKHDIYKAFRMVKKDPAMIYS